jgi:hypothetical protein
MKKLLVVCTLILCGGAFYIYLTAQTLSVENQLSPKSGQPFFAATVPAEQLPGPAPCAAFFAPSPLPHIGYAPDSSPSAIAVVRPLAPVTAPEALPDISKFRLPVEYKLKNIPAISLLDFLMEQHFQNLDVTDNGEANTISITASLADHRTILKLMVEIEREIEAIRNAAANVTGDCALPILIGPSLQL